MRSSIDFEVGKFGKPSQQTLLAVHRTTQARVRYCHSAFTLFRLTICDSCVRFPHVNGTSLQPYGGLARRAAGPDRWSDPVGFRRRRIDPSADQSGKVSFIGVTSDARSPDTPDFPTFTEQGVPAFRAVVCSGLFAPAGTPPKIIDRQRIGE